MEQSGCCDGCVRLGPDWASVRHGRPVGLLPSVSASFEYEEVNVGNEQESPQKLSPLII